MSWTVDGHTYHDYNEYQRALERGNSSRARAEADTARREAQRLQSRIRDREQELARSRDDLRQQIAINAAIQQDVTALQRVQNRLERAQQRMERDVTRQFTEVRAHLAENRAELARLDERQKAHAAEVRRQFEEARVELARGLDEAERRRQQTEERLSGRIREVDAKVDADRKARAEKEASRRARAEQAAVFAERELGLHVNSVGPLGLEASLKGIQSKIGAARTLLQQGDESAALALASTSDVEARHLGWEVEHRRATLNARRDSAIERADRVKRDLDESLVQALFMREREQALLVCDRVAEQARTGYERYDRAEVEAARHEQILARLEEETSIMAAAAPSLADLARDRTERAKALIGHLRGIYGPLSDVRQRQAVEGDRKSAMIVECEFGRARVDLHLQIDGTYTLDGYGHDSNATCASQGTAVAEVVGRAMTVEARHTDTANRSGPARRNESASEDQGNWHEMASRLSDIKRKL